MEKIAVAAFVMSLINILASALLARNQEIYAEDLYKHINHGRTRREIVNRRITQLECKTGIIGPMKPLTVEDLGFIPNEDEDDE